MDLYDYGAKPAVREALARDNPQQSPPRISSLHVASSESETCEARNEMVMLTYDILVRGVTFFLVDGGRPSAVGVAGPSPFIASLASVTSVRTPGGQYLRAFPGFWGEAG